jgi:hypothetical protein
MSSRQRNLIPGVEPLLQATQLDRIILQLYNQTKRQTAWHSRHALSLSPSNRPLPLQHVLFIRINLHVLLLHPPPQAKPSQAKSEQASDPRARSKHSDFQTPFHGRRDMVVVDGPFLRAQCAVEQHVRPCSSRHHQSRLLLQSGQSLA